VTMTRNCPVDATATVAHTASPAEECTAQTGSASPI
jgi:hypothetical protein